MGKEIELELGYGLLPLLNKKQGSLLEGIKSLRKEHPEIPKVHITDNITLEPKQFCVEKKKYSLESNPEDISCILDAISEYAKNI